MSQQNTIILMIAAALAFVLMKKKTVQASGNNSVNTNQSQEIFTQGDPMGWRYFTNGTAISPEGDYYQNGVKVYTGQ
jgi:hypothetical protein